MSERDRKILIIGGIVVGILLSYLLIFRPLGNAVDDGQERIASRSETLAEMESIHAQLKQLQAQVPQGNDNVNLLSYFEGLARQAGLKDHIDYMKPGQGIQIAGVRRNTVEVKLTKVNLKQLTDLLFQAERGGRFPLAVDEIHIKKRFDNPELLDVTLEVYQS